ncbi:MAG: hypothetical protein EBS74_07450, partial [Flavobacteriia bacterium]|nr:hypothetical protein [Flavobacteriia bacterium]
TAQYVPGAGFYGIGQFHGQVSLGFRALDGCAPVLQVHDRGLLPGWHGRHAITLAETAAQQQALQATWRFNPANQQASSLFAFPGHAFALVVPEIAERLMCAILRAG